VTPPAPAPPIPPSPEATVAAPKRAAVQAPPAPPASRSISPPPPSPPAPALRPSAPPRPIAPPVLPDVSVPEPERSPAGRSPVAAVVVALLVVVGLVVAYLMRGDGGGAVAPGTVRVDVQPWATVEIIDLASNAPVALPVRETPCRVTLPPGKYEVRLRHQRFGELKAPLSVEAGKMHDVKGVLPGFKPEQVIDKL